MGFGERGMRRHLAIFRMGWQSENLARYILSNFAFVSQPSTIADDIGSDFFCTLFERVPYKNREYLVPKESFAIQIKSSNRSFSVSGKSEYLRSLGIPFFVGVIDKNIEELNLYSGEYLIPFFAEHPTAETVKIRLCTTDDCRKPPYSEESGLFSVNFYKLITIGSNPGSPDFRDSINKLSEACRTISGNITRKNNREYIFADSICRGFIMVGNEDVIRKSLSQRLVKISFELSYILENRLIETDVDKYQRIRDALMRL
jgi:hypothetical protein